MDKIERLPAELSSRLPEIVAEWIKIGLSCDEADRASAYEGACKAYAAANMPPPKIVIWLDSPLQGAVAAALLLLSGTKVAGAQVWNQVWDQVWNQVWNQVRAQVEDQVRNKVWNQVWNQVEDQVRNQARNQVWNQVWVGDQVWNQVGPQVWDQVGPQVWNQVWDQVWNQVGPQVWTQVWRVRRQVGDQVGDQARVGDQVGPQVWNQVWDQVWNQVGPQVWDQVTRCCYGQQDAGWLSFYDTFRSLVPAVHRMDGLMQIARACGWWWPFANGVIFTERPRQISRDHLSRLHSADGPAVSYRDSFAIYAWKGLRVPAELIDKRHEMTSQSITAIENAEHRRVAIELYAHMHGPERFVADLGAKLIKSDELHGRPRHLYALGDARFVHVVNGSLEPDGSRREFLLGAPPDSKSPKAAIAASFGRPVKKYREAVRT